MKTFEEIYEEYFEPCVMPTVTRWYNTIQFIPKEDFISIGGQTLHKCYVKYYVEDTNIQDNVKFRTYLNGALEKNFKSLLRDKGRQKDRQTPKGTSVLLSMETDTSEEDGKIRMLKDMIPGVLDFKDIEFQMDLDYILQPLTDLQRRVITCRLINNLSVKETGALLNKSEASVSNAQIKGLIKLRKHLVGSYY